MSVEEHGDFLYERMRAGDDIGKVIDLGHDVRITLTVRQDGGGPVGFIETHPTPEGRGCSGQVVFDVPEAEGLGGPRWQLLSLDPLHIEPSVLCRGCGHHGFVRDGRWVPA